MTILITGATGFIGSFLVHHLLERIPENLILFDYFINKKRIKDIVDNPNVTVIQGDLSNWSELVSLFNEYSSINAIYHFGSLMPPFTETNLEAAFKINIQGSFNILECARLFKVTKVFYSSSGAVYGPGVDLPVTEKSFRDPWTMYGVCKVCSEVLGTFYHRRKNIHFTTLRFPALIGPGRTGTGMTMFANNIIQYPAQGQKAICNVEPDVTVPIVYIKDAVHLLASLLEKNQVFEQAYNLDGVWLSAEDLANLVKQEIPDAKIEYEPNPELSFQLKSWSIMRGDDSLVRKDLNYTPLYTPDEFVKDFIAEVQDNPQFQI